MIRKLSPGCLGVVLLCLSASLLAQEKPADYSTVVPLTLGGEGPWYRLELPLALQAQARQADLNDVRVFNSAGSRRPMPCSMSRRSRPSSAARPT